MAHSAFESSYLYARSQCGIWRDMLVQHDIMTALTFPILMFHAMFCIIMCLPESGILFPLPLFTNTNIWLELSTQILTIRGLIYTNDTNSYVLFLLLPAVLPSCPGHNNIAPKYIWGDLCPGEREKEPAGKKKKKTAFHMLASLASSPPPATFGWSSPTGTNPPPFTLGLSHIHHAR